MEFIYYLDKKDLLLYGYESDEVARKFHDNYESLLLLDEETSNEYRFNKPSGGVWDIEKMEWVVGGYKLKEELQLEKEAQIQNLSQRIQNLNLKIQEHLLMDEKQEAKELVLQKRKLEEELNSM